VSKAEKQIVAG